LKTLVQTVALNGAATLVRLFTQIAITKILAVSVGPAGLVIVGQIQNLISLLGSGSTLGLFGGVVKLTADGSVPRERVWSTALGISGINAAIWLIVSIFFAQSAARFLFHDAGKAYIVILCAAANLFVVLQALIFHVLSGLRAFKLHVACSVLNSIVGLLMVGFAAAFGGSGSIFIVICFSQAIAVIGAVIAMRQLPALNPRNLIQGVSRDVIAKLAPFIAIGLTSAITLPMSQMLVRAHLINTFGVIETGYWEAAMKISLLYSSLIGTAFGLYLLPTFARATTDSQLRSELRQALTVLSSVLVVAAALQYLLRDGIIASIFSTEFAVSANLLALQLPGDIARGLLMVLILANTSRAQSWLVIGLNVIFGAGFYMFALLLSTKATGLPIDTIAGASLAYTLAAGAALLAGVLVNARLIFS
jgi:PST family polysaccharide transporter